MGGDADVVRGDVAMQQVCLVHRAQRVHYGQQEPHGEVEGDACFGLALQVFLQRDAGHVFHDDVAGAVGTEEVLHADHAGVLVEARQRAGLVDEAREAVVEGLGLVAVDAQADPVAAAGGAVPRQVLLDGQGQRQVLVECQVGDAEAAVAEDPAEAVAAIEQAADRQEGRRVVGARLPAAGAAGRAGGWLEATGAVLFHVDPAHLSGRLLSRRPCGRVG